MFFSQKLLRRILGALWLIDGILQLQPKMFTTAMVNGILLPMTQSQPTAIAANLHAIVDAISQHLTLVNVAIGVIEVEIGLFLIAGLWVRGAIITSVVWALIVWYAGEGMSMLFTGQASVLTGAPGAVLLYPLLGLLVYPRKAPTSVPEDASAETGGDNFLFHMQPRRVLGGLWILAALLQLQPYWWQQGQISQTIGAMVGQGGFNQVVVDPVLGQLSTLSATLEIPLNLALSVVFLVLGIALLKAKGKGLRPLLIISIVLSLLIWWGAQAFGMIFTGLATDFNSGLLFVCITLVCWPKLLPRQKTHKAQTEATQDVEGQAQSIRIA